MSRPAMGMLLIEDPITYPSATGMTWVTPSPESITVPVRDRSDTLEDVQDAARASTAWTAMYSPAQLKDSNIISAVFSRFSGGLRGCRHASAQLAYWGKTPTDGFCEKEMVVFGFDAQVLEY